MLLKVTPTRISLLNLKKELRVAVRGHRLLKDKRDGLMKKFLAIVREAREVRDGVEKNMGGAFSSYAKASAVLAEKNLKSAFILPSADVKLSVRVKSIMSVQIPEFEVKKSGNVFSYGFLGTNGDLDNAILKFDEVFPDIIRLAALEKTAELLAIEIERTRRRVSALENNRIPSLQETIRFVTRRLEEQGRDAVVATMRVKAMLTAREQ